jgi:hypothetical protein
MATINRGKNINPNHQSMLPQGVENNRVRRGKKYIPIQNRSVWESQKFICRHKGKDLSSK